MSNEPIVIYDFDPNNLPPDMLRAIGLVVAASAQTESILQQFIGALLGIDDVETITVTAHMSHPLKDDVARALIELNAKHVEVVDMADDVLDAINTAFEKRNVLVHNSFARHPETGEVFSHRERARGSTQIELKPIRVEEIEQDAALIYKVGMDLLAFMIMLGIKPAERTRPIHFALNRKKKARLERRASRGDPRD